MDLGDIVNVHQSELQKNVKQKQQEALQSSFEAEHGKKTFEEQLLDTFTLPNWTQTSDEAVLEFKRICAAEQAARLVCRAEQSESRFDDYKEFALFLTKQYLKPMARVDAMKVHQNMRPLDSEVTSAFQQLVSCARVIAPDDHIIRENLGLPAWFFDLPSLQKDLAKEEFIQALIALGHSIAGGRYSDSRKPPLNVIKMIKRKKLSSLHKFVNWADTWMNNNQQKNHENSDSLDSAINIAEGDVCISCNHLKTADSIGHVLSGVTYVLLLKPDRFQRYWAFAKMLAQGAETSYDAGITVYEWARATISLRRKVYHQFFSYVQQYSSEMGIDRFAKLCFPIIEFLKRDKKDIVENIMQLAVRLPKNLLVKSPGLCVADDEPQTKVYFELAHQMCDSLQGRALDIGMNALYGLFYIRQDSHMQYSVSSIKDFITAGIQVCQQFGEESAITFFERKTQASRSLLRGD